jgi:hypothetical protein
VTLTPWPVPLELMETSGPPLSIPRSSAYGRSKVEARSRRAMLCVPCRKATQA